jgi:hypothetical protein
MKEVIFAIVAGGIGLSLLFLGYKLARFLIPIWAFFAGFSLGAAGVADATNNSFLGTTMGIVIGLVIGSMFALLSYFFYSLAIVLLGANLGYFLGTSFVVMLGLDKGFVSATVGIVAGIIFALLTISLNLAKYLLIGLTSMAGSVVTIGGVMLLFNQIELSAFDYTTTKVAITNSVIWNISFITLLLLGIAVQYLTNKNYVLEQWTTSYGAPKNNTVYKDEK